MVDDDADVREVVTDCLEEGGYQVKSVGEGRDVVNLIASENINLVIIDLGLPDTDGLILTREIRANFQVGLIILSGRTGSVEKTIGLEIGADDYVEKPFDPRELLARVRSVLRRQENAVGEGIADSPTAGLMFEGWTLNPDAMTVTNPEGAMPTFKSSEFTLLQAFLEHPNRVLTRDQLLDFVHGKDSPAYDRSIDVLINRVRKLIEINPKEPLIIKTVRNHGYMFASKVTKQT
ncbi:MAG: response regulator transcription factor [Rhodospirillales bacterium]|nr:response regulator transcription factor [Rhodospirillaceae bacterium]MBT5034367.1 response regulator transcription factor [Rhodospirillaceae bacterium]MBT8003121.1 response regulator transcription factor [Rhodospirillales bacterium]